MLGEHSLVLADIRRWAWFNSMGAQMCRMDTGKPHGPSLAPEDPACAHCGQLHGYVMSDLVEQDRSLPCYCRSCEAEFDRLDAESYRVETVRLFEPAPNVTPGQLSL